MLHFINFTDRVTNELKNVFEYSNRQARKIGEKIYGTEVLLYGIVEEGNSYAASSLSELSLIPEWLRRKTLRMQKNSYIRLEIEEDIYVCPNENIGYALEIADDYREHFKDKVITTDHVFLALLKNPEPSLLEVFKGCNIDIMALKRRFVRKLALENDFVVSYFYNNPEDSIIPPLFSYDEKYPVIEKDSDLDPIDLDPIFMDGYDPEDEDKFKDEEIFYNDDDEEDKSAKSIISGLFISKKDKAEKQAKKDKAEKEIEKRAQNNFEKNYLATESEIFNQKVANLDRNLSYDELQKAYGELVSNSISDSISASLEASRDEHFNAYLKEAEEEREEEEAKAYEPSPTHK